MTTPDGDELDPAVEHGVDLSDPEYYLNRELSQLAFQKRVLHEALDERTPLLERVRFLSIFTRNMDEFFMKRIGGLDQQIDAGVSKPAIDGRTPAEQWEIAIETARPMFDAQTACYHEEIRPALADAGIHVLSWEDLTAAERTEMREWFEETILSTLTPLSFDPARPFPFISNLSLSLGVLVRADPTEEATFTRIKIPPNQPRLMAISEGERYVLLEEVIRGSLDLLLPSVEILETAMFRVTRNAEVRRDEEIAEDLISMIEEVLEQRKFATVVRLEIEEGMSARMVDLLKSRLDLDDCEVFELANPLGFREFADLLELERPELKREPWTPQPHPRLRTGTSAVAGLTDGESVFTAIREDDILVHHPYHSFSGTVQRFLDEAATDPDVRAIKAAIYRTASDSQVIQSLIEAADNGKQVVVMVELKARFDERNNLEWVRKLEEEGIHVAYGTMGLKTHTKTALVVREEDDSMRLYSHVATGNYHSETAKGYVDLGLLTADRDIGRDLVRLFNFYTGPAIADDFHKLLIAPVTMREEFTGMIRREAEHARLGRPARIVAKMNALEDPDIVRELYLASMAGVDIDLIIRDICRLRPGLDGVSETVSVYSVVGRFLEHSRIYYFENGGDPEYYIGSADWMTRNLDNRVEAVTPVEDPRIRAHLRFVLEVMLADNRNCWEMHADGSYTQRRPEDDEPEWSTQQILVEQTLATLRLDDPIHGIQPTHPAATGELLIEPQDEDEGRSSSGPPAPGDGAVPPEDPTSGDDVPDTVVKSQDR